MTEEVTQQLTVRDIVEDVQAELLDEFKNAKKKKLRKMMLEIEGLKQTLKLREDMLEEFLNQPLEVEDDGDIFYLEA